MIVSVWSRGHIFTQSHSRITQQPIFFITVHFFISFPEKPRSIFIVLYAHGCRTWFRVRILKSFVLGSICCFFFNTKSLINPFLVLCILASPICIAAFPVIWTLLSLVIPDLVLCSLRSLCAIVFVGLGFASCSLHYMFYDIVILPNDFLVTLC